MNGDSSHSTKIGAAAHNASGRHAVSAMTVIAAKTGANHIVR